MRVLVACEESQVVCKAFRALGHEAYSCDIQPCSGGHPEWHIQGDALDALYGQPWDLVIAHPPCTYLTAASAVRLFNRDHTVKDFDRLIAGWEAKDFFLKFLNAPVSMVCVENPCPLRVFCLPSYSQIIEPYMFGDPWKKRTCLWLRGLPELVPTNLVEPLGLWVGSTSGRSGTGRVKSDYTLASHRDQKMRSKTFPGIAAAMASQWSTFAVDKYLI